MPRSLRRSVGACTAGTLVASALATGLASPAGAVSSDVVATLVPGGLGTTVTQVVDVPPAPPQLDFGLIVDLSGSYGNDLPVLRTLAGNLATELQSRVPDTRLGAASFVDFPFSPWGSPGGGSQPSDYAYQLEGQLSAAAADFTAAVGGMRVLSGVDEPESQYEALFQAVTGAGRDVPSATVGRGDIAPGQEFAFRPAATKVIALTTDATFHLAGTPSGSSLTPFGYPGASESQVISALQAAGVVVIGLSTPAFPGSGSFPADPFLERLATATGGSVQRTTSDSSDIVDAILAGIQAIEYDVRGEAVGCGPVAVSIAPPTRNAVPAGSSTSFDETYSVPTGTPEGVVECRVDYYAGDALIDSHDVAITVDAPPAVTVDVPETTDEGLATAVTATRSGAPSGSWSATGDPSNDAGADCAFADPTALSTTVTCDDDGLFSISYTAADGTNPDATDASALAVGNVAPVLGAVTATGGGTACGGTVTLAAAATDAGTNDAPVGVVVDWGDGTSSAPGSHTYASGGTFNATTTADDLDGGTDTASTSFSFNTLVGSGFQQPINADGSSRFKIGSTIPVKTRIVDCEGLGAAGRAPEVRLFKIDSTPSGEVNEVVSSSAADVGRTMRDQGDGQYHYNLSTKLSQFCPSGACSNGNLTPGTYELRVVQSGLATQVVRFDLRS